MISNHRFSLWLNIPLSDHKIPYYQWCILNLIRLSLFAHINCYKPTINIFNPDLFSIEMLRCLHLAEYLKAIALAMKDRYRGMVRDHLTKISESGSYQLVSFTQKGVERLA